VCPVASGPGRGRERHNPELTGGGLHVVTCRRDSCGCASRCRQQREALFRLHDVVAEMPRRRLLRLTFFSHMGAARCCLEEPGGVRRPKTRMTHRQEGACSARIRCWEEGCGGVEWMRVKVVRLWTSWGTIEIRQSHSTTETPEGQCDTVMYARYKMHAVQCTVLSITVRTVQ
jgi:hypothetical protein